MGYDGAVVMRLLAAEHGIVVAAGSACAAETRKTSHVLHAMGLDNTFARGLLRISPGYSTTMEDIDAFLKALHHVVQNY